MEEIWKPIPRLDSYEASSLGRIRSITCRKLFKTSMTRWGKKAYRLHAGRILKLKKKPNGSGNYYHCFYANGKYPQVNRSVCETFHGAPPSDQHEAAHLNGDSLDDRSENLIWASPTENAAHKKIHGTDSTGSKNGCSRLTETDISIIFDRFIAGEKTGQIAKSCGLSQSGINIILSRKTWRHVAIDDKRVLAAAERAKKNILETSLQNIEGYKFKKGQNRHG